MRERERVPPPFILTTFPPSSRMEWREKKKKKERNKNMEKKKEKGHRKI